MTKQEKLFLYKTALEYIAEGKETLCGLCNMLQTIANRSKKIIDIYYHLEMTEVNGLFSKATSGGFEELTDQMIGKPFDEYWFPEGEWNERKQLLLNAINILENETT